jgi:hypothetical protein
MVMGVTRWLVGLLALVAVGFAGPALAQRVQTPTEAFAQDAGAYARRYGVTSEEASVRLRALQASAAVTDRIRQAYRERLVGISIDHAPTLQIVVLLTGAAHVADTSFAFEGISLPVRFRTGASATGDDVIRAMLQRGPELVALLPRARGMGLDARSGELVILVGTVDAARADLAAIRSRAEALTGVRVRFDLADRAAGNLSLAGGARIVGVHSLDGQRYACTTGFAVTDGTRTGIATAAHCPDEVVYQDPDGGTVPLAFAGQWGARTQDVQVNVSPIKQEPLFYADRRQGALRMVAGMRSRLSTRAGEWLCHYGESSGYSCAEVELTQFAPPGELCAGVCAPTWVSVRTNDCRRGDSGGPVFSGDIAFGITKGGSGGRGTRCNFYFYMSTDFLPAGWRLLRSGNLTTHYPLTTHLRGSAKGN